MKINKILFVVFFCVGAQSGVIFGSEVEGEQAPQTQSWREWAGSYMTSAKEKAQAAAAAAKEKAQAAAAEVAKKAQLAQEAKKGYGNLTRENIINWLQMVGIGIPTDEAKRVGAAGVDALLLNALRTFAKRFVRSGNDPHGVLTLFGEGAFVLETIFADMIDFNLRDKMKSDENKINDIKTILRAELSNEITYPTFSRKIDGLELLKKNKSRSRIIGQVYNELIEEIKLQSRTSESVAADSAIEEAIKKINVQLNNVPLKDRIKTLLTPEFKAKMFIFFRLKKEQDSEKIPEGTFEKASLSQLY